MKRLYFLVITTAVLLLMIVACRKEVQKAAVTYKPTSTEVDVPGYVLDSVGAVDMPVDNALTVEGVALGRELFYEKRLSNTSTLSCGSCHKQSHAFADSLQFSRGTNGSVGTRNPMALLNEGWGRQFFWDGRQATLEKQAHDPVTNPIEMANTWPVVVQRLQEDGRYQDLFYAAFGTRVIDSVLVTKALAQFERTLVSFNSKFDNSYEKPGSLSSFTPQEEDGRLLFFGRGTCSDCHRGVLLSDHVFRNNGLDATLTDKGLGEFTHLPGDAGKFKVPTLRNIALTAPYMHDGRFKTLEEVVEFYSSGIKQRSPNIDGRLRTLFNFQNFNEAEKAALVAFMKTLTDSGFVANAAFKDPN